MLTGERTVMVMTTHAPTRPRLGAPAVTLTPGRAGRVADRVVRLVARRPRWHRELVLVALVYLVYDGIRLLPDVRRSTALANGHRILRAEKWLGVSPERWLDQGLHRLPALAVIASYSYESLHYLVTPLVLIWVFRRHLTVYRRARNWLMVMTLTGLLGFWLFPAAPPRMLPGDGVYDIVSQEHRWGWWSANSAAPHGLGGLVDQFAAMPSLHVGWALWSGWQIATLARHRSVRVLGAAYPVFIALVVMSTGNHYLLDVLAGGVVAAWGFGVAVGAQRLGRRLLIRPGVPVASTP
jgi:hypothetical protein